MILKTKCAIYARYSSANQREASIDDQIRVCTDFANSRDWVVLQEHIYSDKAVSGKSIAPRDSLKALLEVALSKNPPFEYVIVDSTSRVARNTREALGVFESLRANGVYVYYVSQGIDTQKETAAEMITIHGMVDSVYLRDLSHNTRRGLVGQVENGYSGGGRHYGYKSKPVEGNKVDRYGNKEIIGYKYVIDPEEAETIIRIFTYFGVKGWSAKRIANLLNKEIREYNGRGPKPPRGEFWSNSTILGSKKSFRGILNCVLFIGKYIWGKRSAQDGPNGQRRTSTNDPRGWVVDERPELRIISDDLWNAVKRRQKEITEKTKGDIHNSKFLYSANLMTTIANCGTCCGRIVVTSGGKWGKYGCSNNWNHGLHACPNSMKIKKEILEETVLAILCKELVKKDSLAMITSEIHVLLQQILMEAAKGRMKDVIENDLKDIQQEIENISAYIKRGTGSLLPDRLLVAAEDREKKLQNELALLEIKNFDDLKLSELLTPKDLEDYFAKVIDRLINPATTRETLYEIIDKIVIYFKSNTTIEIEIHEKTEKTMTYVLDLIAKEDTRIRVHTGTGQHSYTSRIFKCTIGLPLNGNMAVSIENLVVL